MEPIEPKILKDGEMCRLLHGADHQDQDKIPHSQTPDRRNANANGR